jgi:hypothetical protein
MQRALLGIPHQNAIRAEVRTSSCLASFLQRVTLLSCSCVGTYMSLGFATNLLLTVVLDNLALRSRKTCHGTQHYGRPSLMIGLSSLGSSSPLARQNNFERVRSRTIRSINLKISGETMLMQLSKILRNPVSMMNLSLCCSGAYSPFYYPHMLMNMKL